MPERFIRIHWLVVATIFVLLSTIGCFHRGYLGHEISTNVLLAKKNYHLVATHHGEASEIYILGLFGRPDQNLYWRAKQDMLKDADLMGKPRALVNVATDETSAYYFLWRQKTVHLSCDVIEFTE